MVSCRKDILWMLTRISKSVCYGEGMKLVGTNKMKPFLFEFSNKDDFDFNRWKSNSFLCHSWFSQKNKESFSNRPT